MEVSVAPVSFCLLRPPSAPRAHGSWNPDSSLMPRLKEFSEECLCFNRMHRQTDSSTHERHGCLYLNWQL